MPEISLGVSKIFVKCYISPGKNLLWLSYCFAPIASTASGTLHQMHLQSLKLNLVVLPIIL